MTRPCIAFYLRGMAAAALETSRDLRLLPVFLRIVAIVPATIAQLIGD